MALVVPGGQEVGLLKRPKKKCGKRTIGKPNRPKPKVSGDFWKFKCFELARQCGERVSGFQGTCGSSDIWNLQPVLKKRAGRNWKFANLHSSEHFFRNSDSDICTTLFRQRDCKSKSSKLGTFRFNFRFAQARDFETLQNARQAQGWRVAKTSAGLVGLNNVRKDAFCVASAGFLSFGGMMFVVVDSQTGVWHVCLEGIPAKRIVVVCSVHFKWFFWKTTSFVFLHWIFAACFANTWVSRSVSQIVRELANLQSDHALFSAKRAYGFNCPSMNLSWMRVKCTLLDLCHPCAWGGPCHERYQKFYALLLETLSLESQLHISTAAHVVRIFLRLVSKALSSSSHLSR